MITEILDKVDNKELNKKLDKKEINKLTSKMHDSKIEFAINFVKIIKMVLKTNIEGTRELIRLQEVDTIIDMVDDYNSRPFIKFDVEARINSLVKHNKNIYFKIVDFVYDSVNNDDMDMMVDW